MAWIKMDGGSNVPSVSDLLNLPSGSWSQTNGSYTKGTSLTFTGGVSGTVRNNVCTVPQSVNSKSTLVITGYTGGQYRTLTILAGEDTSSMTQVGTASVTSLSSTTIISLAAYAGKSIYINIRYSGVDNVNTNFTLTGIKINS